MSTRRLPLPLLVPLMAGLATVAAAQKKGYVPDKAQAHDINPNREQGVGTIPLGATARGMIVQGFYNMISFEAVAGTKVSLKLKTRHKVAEPLADLYGPNREHLHEFEAPAVEEGEAPPKNELVLQEFVVPETGSYAVHFGFQREENGAYELTTTAEFPAGFEKKIHLDKGKAAISLDGMLGRRLARLEFLTPDGKQIDVTLVDPRGNEIDLSRKLTRTTFGRRVTIRDVVIESTGEYRVLLEETSGAELDLDVEVEYKNPPLSAKSLKI